MWYITFILKNLARRPFRSVLTITAIAIAVGSFVTLVGISSGFERAFLQLYQGAGIDLIVVRTGGTQRLNSTLESRLGDKILHVPGVKEVLPGLVDVVSFDQFGLYGVIVQGWEPETKVFEHHLTITEGRTLRRDDKRAAILGTTLAQSMGKKVGDEFDLIENEPFTVVGIYESSNVFENGAMVVPLRELQRVMDRPGQVTGFSVILEKSGDKAAADEVKGRIKDLQSGVTALTTLEHVQSLSEIQQVQMMAWLTSAIAVLIGSFGIVNTMMMSVQERTREIGILRAVGWRKRRVVCMILLESVVLSLAGACVGAGVGALIMKLLPHLRVVSGIVDGYVNPVLILQAFGIALVLGFLGGLLPAYHAARMLPTAALRHE